MKVEASLEAEKTGGEEAAVIWWEIIMTEVRKGKKLGI